MYFEIIGEITAVETFATGSAIRELPRLQAEIHWYEAHGIGRKEFKIKRYID